MFVAAVLSIIVHNGNGSGDIGSCNGNSMCNGNGSGDIVSGNGNSNVETVGVGRHLSAREAVIQN